jgi:catalase
MTDSDHRDLSKRLYEALLTDYPDHKGGTRPVHAIGIGATGYFVPTDGAKAYSCAEQFAGPRVAVTIRFSNGSGSPVEHDDALDVRGMATKFHLGEERVADLIMITLPVFFAQTPDEFLAFAHAGVPRFDPKPTLWQKVINTLMLRPIPTRPDPKNPFDGAAGVLRYANRHAAARAGTIAALMLVTPTSYARATYHALHSFKVKNAAGVERFVRLSWEPVAGVRPVDTNEEIPEDYLHLELAQRLTKQPARFVLRMVVAGEDDDVNDPTKMWDTTRLRVVMGELFITELVKDQDGDCEKLSFNPTRVVAGLECSNDPVLAARGDAYAYSCSLRGGTGCPVGSGWR